MLGVSARPSVRERRGEESEVRSGRRMHGLRLPPNVNSPFPIVLRAFDTSKLRRLCYKFFDVRRVQELGRQVRW